MELEGQRDGGDLGGAKKKNTMKNEFGPDALIQKGLINLRSKFPCFSYHQKEMGKPTLLFIFSFIPLFAGVLCFTVN